MLLSSVVENPARCLSICSESYGWVVHTNKLVDQPKNLWNYSEIGKSIRETAAAQLGASLNKDSATLKKHKLIAVYDTSGNLLAAASFSFFQQKNILKIQKLVSALWNVTPQESVRMKGIEVVKGAGSAAMACAMQTALELSGKESVNLFLEPTEEAISFYEKCGFVKVEGWEPKEFGAACGMSLKVTKATLAAFQEKLAQKGYEKSAIVAEKDLPKTKLNFDKLLSFEVSKDAEWA